MEKLTKRTIDMRTGKRKRALVKNDLLLESMLASAKIVTRTRETAITGGRKEGRTYRLS